MSDSGRLCAHGVDGACFTCDVVPMRPELLRFARRLTRTGPDAEDLLQETYLHAYRGLATFDPGTNMMAWLRRIMKNVWINNQRSAQRRPTTVSMAHVDDYATGRVAIMSSAADSFVIALEPDSEVLSAMAALSDDFRLTVYLADVEGYPHAAIAEMMGTPIGTVMSRLHRARRQLRTSLTDTVRRRRLLSAA